MDGTVWTVAQAAVFSYGCVLPQEWAAFFSMAGITGLVQCGLDQYAARSRAMGGMTFAAGHFTEADGVLRSLIEFCTHFLVTAKANFRLGFFLQYRIFSHMNGVATGAGDITATMGTA